VRAREKSGHSCPAHKIERKGKNGPQLPSFRQGQAWVFIFKFRQRQYTLQEGMNSQQKGRRKK